jgi:hypothetical protein
MITSNSGLDNSIIQFLITYKHIISICAGGIAAIIILIKRYKEDNDKP